MEILNQNTSTLVFIFNTNSSALLVEFFGFPEKYGEAVTDRYLFLRHFYRYEKARDVPLVFVSYVSTWSYVGIKRILVGPNGFRY